MCAPIFFKFIIYKNKIPIKNSNTGFQKKAVNFYCVTKTYVIYCEINTVFPTKISLMWDMFPCSERIKHELFSLSNLCFQYFCHLIFVSEIRTEKKCIVVGMFYLYSWTVTLLFFIDASVKSYFFSLLKSHTLLRFQSLLVLQ